jgi:Dienelactone hydrolase family
MLSHSQSRSLGPRSRPLYSSYYSSLTPANTRGEPMNREIRLRDGTSWQAYVAGDLEKSPAIIVLHEVWGLGNHIENVCDRLSKRGFAAIAPHLFWQNEGLFTTSNVREAMSSVWDLSIRDRFDPSQLKKVLEKKNQSEGIRELLTTLYSKDFRGRTLDRQNRSGSPRILFRWWVRFRTRSKI